MSQASILMKLDEDAASLTAAPASQLWSWLCVKLALWRWVEER